MKGATEKGNEITTEGRQDSRPIYPHSRGYISGIGLVPHVKSGKIVALAVTTPQPSPFYPGLPTVIAAGVPGYEYSVIQAVFVPAKTPAAIVTRLHQEIVRALNEAEIEG